VDVSHLRHAGNEVDTVRLRRTWRMISLLARTGVMLGLIALVLLPVFSTADDFHTCTLYKVPSPSRPLQVGAFTTGARLVQGPCLACYWQSLIGTASSGSPLGVKLQPLSILPLGQPTGDRLEMRLVRHGRAPPFSFPYID
jgi:hypothetical protein